jgi:hypothetical protein
VKICDFGLAKEMYQDKYKKKTEVCWKRLQKFESGIGIVDYQL